MLPCKATPAAFKRALEECLDHLESRPARGHTRGPWTVNARSATIAHLGLLPLPSLEEVAKEEEAERARQALWDSPRKPHLHESIGKLTSYRRAMEASYHERETSCPSAAAEAERLLQLGRLYDQLELEVFVNIGAV
jgi:hypothetical protein